MRTRRRGTRAPPYGAGALSTRRGRRPAVERSGTNALGVRRPVSAAAPRCKALAVRGCRRRRMGERNCRAISLPPSALRAATSLAEGGKGKRIPTPVCALARNDRGTGRTESSAPTMRDVEDAVPYGVTEERGRQSRPPLQSGTRATRKRDVEDAVPYGVTGERGGQSRPPLQCATGAPQ